MTRNAAIGIVVGLAVLLGGGYYLMNPGTASAPEAVGVQGTNTGTSGETAQAGEVKTSLDVLAKRSGSWKCTVDVSQVPSISSGVAYIANGKVRSDFTTKVPGYGDVETHLLVLGDDFYTWSSLMTQGTKINIAGKTYTPDKKPGEVSAWDNYTFDCQPWVEDASLLAPPANITFKSL